VLGVKKGIVQGLEHLDAGGEGQCFGARVHGQGRRHARGIGIEPREQGVEQHGLAGIGGDGDMDPSAGVAPVVHVVANETRMPAQ
jgi:hypothetical protein